MYSEAEDFKEKIGVFSRMVSAMSLMQSQSKIQDCKLALEIGGSGGLLAGIVSNVGPKVLCSDIVDVQVKYNGEFPKLLKEKFQRNDLDLDLGKIEFHTMDAQHLIYGDEKFDFVFSLNALEHIPDPIKAINEVWRVLRPGGMFYASFDPIWTADSGSHFLHYTKEPWLHLLVDDDEYCELMKSAGAVEWELNEYRTAMNRLPAGFYIKNLKKNLEELFEKYHLNHWSGRVSEQNNKYGDCAKVAKLTGIPAEELLIRGFEIAALK